MVNVYKRGNLSDLFETWYLYVFLVAENQFGKIFCRSVIFWPTSWKNGNVFTHILY